MTAGSFISPFMLEALLLLILPLLAFGLILLLPKRYNNRSGQVFSLIMVLVTCLSLHLFLTLLDQPAMYARFDWFSAGDKPFQAGVLLNNETLIMLVVVSLIATLVGIFSISYMQGDKDEKKYFAHLGLFVFSMLGIVLSSNLLVLFAFWELVGLSSYLLINHWYGGEIPPRAAGKAFVVNRIGDAGFLLGIALAWAAFGTLELPGLYIEMQSSVLQNADWITPGGTFSGLLLPALGICLFLGAAGKSAQFPLQAWLPDAMAGPTPVSALIHAATMVAAGVFLLARIFPLLSAEAMTLIAITGAVTAFMGAVAAMTQNDIKKVLAFSTISQLGYMVMGMGVGAYDAALFHLFTHAFFKAGLFLAAGAVIHAMHELLPSGTTTDAQDMRNMGGLKSYMPVIFWSFVLLALALSGIPFFSGALSKEAILSGSFAWADAVGGEVLSWYHIVPFLGMVTVALTAYYMGRQVYLVFLGSPRFTSERKKYLVPVSMWLPVGILALMSVGLIWSFNPFSYESSWFFTRLSTPGIMVPGFPVGLQPLLVELSGANHVLVFSLSSAMILVGLGIAFARYRKGLKVIGQARGVFFNLSYHNWWLDSLYQRGVVVPVQRLASLTTFTDRKILDGFINKSAVAGVIFAKAVAWFDRNIVDGMVHLGAWLSKRAGDVFRSVQGGNVQRYIAAAILVMIILFWLIY